MSIQITYLRVPGFSFLMHSTGEKSGRAGPFEYWTASLRVSPHAMLLLSARGL